MAAELLSSRAVIGTFYRRLEQDLGASWLPQISMMFDSNQGIETYPWLGQVPQMREWIGGRQAKGFRENRITVVNRHFESTLEVLLADIRRDKTGQIMVRVGEFAQRPNSHWANLLSTLILGGTTALCYDGQYFFDTDHAEGASGNQSNKIQVDISTLPALVHGSTTAPSVEEMQQAILAAIVQISTFLDDQGEPMNEGSNNFLVMVPPGLGFVARNALALPVGTNVSVQAPLGGFNIALAINARLTWTDTFAVFRTDGSVKPFIRQEETKLQIKAKAEGSEFEFDNDAHQYGIDTWRNVAYGYWQHGCLVTLI